QILLTAVCIIWSIEVFGGYLITDGAVKRNEPRVRSTRLSSLRLEFGSAKRVRLLGKLSSWEVTYFCNSTRQKICVSYHSVNVSCYVIFLCLIMSNVSNIQMPPRRDPDHQEVPQATVATQFHDYHPEKFSGQGDPRIVDEWVQGLEMIFKIMDCPNRYRVLCAQIQLTGDARLWWNAYWGMRPREKEACTWDKFKELICEKYYPAYYRAEIERQFLALKQDTRTVDEYEREFTRLGAFFPDLVSTEAKRSRRFIDGILPAVRHNIVGHGVQSYARTVTIAQEVDASIRREANHDRLQPIAPAQSSSAPPIQPTATQRPKDKKRKEKGFQTDRRIRPRQPDAAKPQQIPPCTTCGRPHRGE
ncbi:Unknown protein, partial [Striga hermonthica]